jgi:type I restriction enzyme R subunit
MSKALGGKDENDGEEPDPEDAINDAIEKRMAARKMLTNASYFAFTLKSSRAQKGTKT